MNYSSPRVAALTVYPLKSAAGIAVDSLPLDSRGASGDRRWLLVNGEGHAITARECHALLHIVPRFATADRNGALLLDAPRHSTLVAVVPDADAAVRRVTVWDDDVEALDAGDEAADWCSTVAGRACRLVRLADLATRPLKRKYAGPLTHEDRQVAFTDGAPLLVLGLPSIDALNTRLLEQGAADVLDPRRFRANVWLNGLTPHEEDSWTRVQIGNVTLGMGSLCTRCVLTTVNPDSLEQGMEPLRTFAQYRRADDGVVFGVNATHAAPGTIHVGDRVVVHARR
ncbi:MOSC domain-containing protein [Gemmatimonas sp.]